MLKNLKIEMLRANVTDEDIAKIINNSIRTVKEKIKGRYYFKANEMFKIQEAYFEKLEISYLFAKE